MSDGGKGSKPRPFSVDQKTFETNWDRIFNKQTEEYSKGDLRINNMGELEEYNEGYWQVIENRR